MKKPVKKPVKKPEEESPPDGRPKIRRNSLTIGEIVKLTGWLQANRETVENSDSCSVAAKATQELGFTVTAINVRSACEPLGIQTKLQASRSPTVDMQIWLVHERAIHRLERSVALIAGELGMTLPT